MNPIVFSILLMLPLAAAEFQSDWQGSRPCVGPEYWAGPLQDWETMNDAVVAVAAKGRLLNLLSHRPLAPENGFFLQAKVDKKLKK